MRVFIIVKPMVKAILRRRMLQHRQVQIADQLPLIEGICSYIADHNITHVAAYAPTATEPGGGTLLLDALASVATTVYLPAATKHHQLRWGIYNSNTPLRIGAFHIAEPAKTPYSSSILAECELILVPGLAGTRTGIRLGKGGGFYDRALAEIDRTNTTLALVLYPWEVLEDIPFEPHDIAMDMIFTADGTIYCDQSV